jgi:hypothetical protein
VRSGADDVKTAALETLGNLAFCRDNRAAVLGAPGLRDWLARLAQDRVSLLTLEYCLRTWHYLRESLHSCTTAC